MRKKVKKIPKYNTGTTGVTAGYLAKNNMPKLGVKFDPSSSGSTGSNSGGSTGSTGRALGSGGGAAAGEAGSSLSMPGGIATASNELLMNTLGIADNSQAGVTLNSAAQGADIGGAIMPGWGHLIGGIAGGALGAFKKGSVDPITGEIHYGGFFGRSKNSLEMERNRVLNTNLASVKTQQLRSDYANQGIDPAPNVLAAEGGIMRRPVDALVSKGELIYNPVTKKLSKVPGSKGKPNKADDVYARLAEGDVVISNSPTMLMANGKTPAQNLENMVDKYATGGAVKAREAIIKKVVNWQETNKTKPQQYATYSGGTDNVKPYGYNKNLEQFKYWDKDKKEYKKEYIDWVNKLTEQDVKDIFDGKYGDMSTYKGVNANYTPTVEEARKLMTDKKYGDWHKIGKAVVDSKAVATKETPIQATPVNMNIIGVNNAMWQSHNQGNYPIKYSITEPTADLKRPVNPSEADGIIAANKILRKQKRNEQLNEIGDYLTSMIPFLQPVFGKYDYDRDPVIATNYAQIPTDYNIDDILRSNYDSYSIGNYNMSQIGGETGKYMATAVQNAANLMKANKDALVYKKNKQNELIAHNVGIRNAFTDKFDKAVRTSIDNTAANKAAADNMRRTDIKNALNYYYGKRNDAMLAAMMNPMFEYGTQEDAYKQIYKRPIV